LGLHPEDVISRPMGSSGSDLITSNAARKKFPFAVECKRSETLNIYKAIDQAEANAEKDNLHPLIVFRKNRSRGYVVLRFDDFLALWKNMR
jgi:hypothetical protein